MELWTLLLPALLWIPTGGLGSSTGAQVVCIALKTCVLPCTFSMTEDFLGITWLKIQENKNIVVHSYINGKDQQDPAFKGRTSLFREQVSRGNASLQLMSVTPSDQGKYQFQVIRRDSTILESVNLRVEGPVEVVKMEQIGDVLVCSSENIYPEPTISWTPHSEQKPQPEEMKNGLYSISSSLSLDVQPPQQFTCNISTRTSWKSATYRLQPPMEWSASVNIPCVDSEVPEKSLKWTFDYTKTIVTRSGANTNYIDPWRPFVGNVSESGSLSLKELSQEQAGVYICELQTEDHTFYSSTELRKQGENTVAIAVGVSVAVGLIMVIIAVVALWRCDFFRKTSTNEDPDQQQKLLPTGGGETNIHQLMQEILRDLSENELQHFKNLLSDQSFMEGLPIIPTNELENENIHEAVMDAFGVRSVSVTKRFLQNIQKNDLLEKLSGWNAEGIIEESKNGMKSRLREKFRFLPGESSGSVEFNEGYTELFITEEDSGQVAEEHAGGQVETHSRRTAQERIVLQNIFKKHSQTGEPTRTVLLTKGVAGVGTTVLTQKFSLDWAESRANQDVQLLFPFTFRELSVLRDRQFSLVGLVHHFFSESKKLFSFKSLPVIFILDGLEEIKLHLDFNQTRVLTDDTESASLEVLLVNLIRGDLLPSARLWITTCPTAANQIPEEFVSKVTEVQGFSDEQREQYFRKRFRNEQKATAVIDHIKSSPSLNMMCRRPVVCRILSEVLQNILEQTERPELPKTLTEIYIHFLLVQAEVEKSTNEGRDEVDCPSTPETRKMVQSLGKLAFEQLQRRNLIFLSDLSECGLNAAEITHYSGFLTEVSTVEPGLDQVKVYCFIHQSLQEFLAALHVHQMFISSSGSPDPHEDRQSAPHSSESPQVFFRRAVNRVLENPNGHQDLALRFLLELSLPTSQSLLKSLLAESDSTNHERVRENGLSADRFLNLLHCLNELNNHKPLEEVQEFLKNDCLSDKDMSPSQWSALSFFLLSSDLEEFDLRKYQASEEALLGLLPVVKASTKVTLSDCHLSDLSCGPLALVLSSSSLTFLDLSNNDLQDPGVKLLCEGLTNDRCKLETLSLCLCGLSSDSCGPLATVLSSSSLKHLDLSNNDLQDSGVEQLCEGLKSATCRLETLRLSGCLVSEKGGASLATSLSSTKSHLRELDLSYNHPKASPQLLVAQNYSGALKSLRFNPAEERFMVPGLRKYACEFSLDPNTAHRRLLLSEDRHTVTFEKEEQQYPDHDDRFIHWEQVLSSTGLRGRCYWEVYWSGRSGENVAVTYKQKGKQKECVFGENNQSWSLAISEGKCTAVHNKKRTLLPGKLSTSSDRVGVFLDSEAGIVSFYEVLSNGVLRHLHTFNTSFTEDLLFPGFRLGSPGSSLSVVTKD